MGCLHPAPLVALFERASDATNAVGEDCNALIEDEQRLRAWKNAESGRQWTEARLLTALVGEPHALSAGEAELRLRVTCSDAARAHRR